MQHSRIDIIGQNGNDGEHYLVDTSRAKELAEAHWNYINATLSAHGVPDDEIEKVGFHYKTAFVHGYGHGQEDAE